MMTQNNNKNKQKIDEKYHNLLDSELLWVEKKAQVLSGWILAMTVIFLNASTHVFHEGELSDFLLFTLIFSAVLVLWFAGTAILISKDVYHPYFKYINIVIQISVVTALMIASAKMVGVEFALTSTPPMLYMLMIGLSSMTLHPKLAIFASFIAAIQFSGAYGLWLAEDANLVITNLNSITWTDIILKSVIFIMMGYTAMVIAKRSRSILERVTRQVSYKEKLSYVEKEIGLAADIQNKLIPELDINLDSFDIQMYYQPAQQVGGDYYDVIQRQDGSLFVIIADVSGKGYSAALLMSNIQAVVRTLIHQQSNLENLVELLNMSLINASVQGRFVSLIVMDIDPVNHRLTYINCGHNPPLIKQDSIIIELDVATPVLGVLDDYVSIEKSIDFHPNDVLFAYTDGVSELYNPEGQQLGMEPIKAILNEYNPAANNNLKDEILQSLTNHMQDEIAHDDISFVLVKQS
jgi:serine phosphatase RsbU (regulator of sigma subunit)